MKDRWIALYVENQVGVLAKISGLFAGKSYAIFALLFGFTFYIQSHNQQLKGKAVSYTHLTLPTT